MDTDRSALIRHIRARPRSLPIGILNTQQQNALGYNYRN